MVSKLRLFGWGACVGLCLVCIGCANSYEASFRPPPGYIYTHTTIPLTTDVDALPVTTLKKTVSETTYVAFPCPIIGYFDCVWTTKPRLREVIQAEDIVYAEAEITTVLSLFGLYKIHTYRK